MDQYELPYDHADWLKFEKQLSSAGPTSSTFSTFGRIASLVTVAAIFATFAIFYFQPEIKNSTETETSGMAQNSEIQMQSTPHPENSNIPQIKDDRIEVAKEELKGNTEITTKIKDKEIVKPNAKKLLPKTKVAPIEPKLIVEEAPVILTKIPNAEFQISTLTACAFTNISFIPVESSVDLSYTWTFGDGSTSTSATPDYSYSEAGKYMVSLEVKDPKSGNRSQWEFPDKIIINPKPDASFTISKEINKYSFIATSGDFILNKWQIHDKQFSNMSLVQNSFNKSGVYLILHICENQESCTDTVLQELQVEIEHPIVMPSAFSPNGDGKNDFFGPNMDCCPEYQFKMLIFNSMGNLLFESNSPKDKWNGQIAGHNKIAEPGVYVYKVITTDKFGNTQIKPGSIVLTK